VCREWCHVRVVAVCVLFGRSHTPGFIHLAETNGPSDISRCQASLIHFFCGSPLYSHHIICKRGAGVDHLICARGRMCLKERDRKGEVASFAPAAKWANYFSNLLFVLAKYNKAVGGGKLKRPRPNALAREEIACSLD
jgi:hypothetical protein